MMMNLPLVLLALLLLLPSPTMAASATVDVAVNDQQGPPSSCSDDDSASASNNNTTGTCATGNKKAEAAPIKSPTTADNESSSASSSTEETTQPHTLSDGKVHELGFGTFESVIGSSSFTLVLFHDREDTSSKTTKQHSILAQLAKEFSQVEVDGDSAFFLQNINLKFATLDTRQHHYIRLSYAPSGSSHGRGQAYDDYYENYRNLDETWSKIPIGMTNSTTFMNLSPEEQPKLPTFFMLFHGNDYNVLDVLDDSTKVDGNTKVFDDDYDSVLAWLGQTIREDIHYAMEGVGKPRLPFGESENGPTPALRSVINHQRKEQQHYEGAEPHPMNTINWEEANRMAYEYEEHKEMEPKFDPSLYTIVHTGEGESFHKYRMDDDVDDENDAEIMSELGRLFDLYLSWANSYENLWDENRKAIEDVRTNYGAHLQQLNGQVHNILLGSFDAVTANKKKKNKSKNNPLLSEQNVPMKMQKYFEDMIFGYGRSATSLQKYLEDVVYTIGDNNSSGNSKKKGKHSTTTNSIELFQRIRDYMSVREDVARDEESERNREKQYNMFFKTIWIKLNAVMAEFQANLSRSYISYREDHPEVTKDRYKFEELDVIDMKDPKNYDLLSNYDEFERRYISQRKAVILSNADLTHPLDYTLDLLVEKCGFVDVTNSVKQSYTLGDKSQNGWGGLSDFKLPKEMMNKDDNDDDDDEKEPISLQMFVTLAQRFDNLYLHDVSLKGECDSLFSDETPYDAPERQYFRIPSVIAQYDLFQKVAYSSYANSWPSLFVGRKGSNSKIHIDSGATGFWMYLIKGKKRWITYDPAERPFLYERFNKYSFIADVLSLNSTTDESQRNIIHEYFDATYPLLNVANSASKGFEIVQEEGQLLYIPPDTPHAVENLEDIIGVAFNLAPRAGVARILHNFMHDIRYFGSVEIILQYLMTEKEGRSSLVDPADPLYVTLGEYMAQY